MAVLLFLFLQFQYPSPLIKWYFPETSKCPQWQKRGKRGISSIHYFFLLRGRARLADKASSSRSRAFTFLGPAGLSVLLLLLQTPRQALLAGTKLPWAGAKALMVKGRVRGHSKSFTNISPSFIISALPTAAHKSTKVHELRACPSASAPSGAPRSIQGTKSADAPRAPDEFRGRGMLRLEWGFGVPDGRAEALKC